MATPVPQVPLTNRSLIPLKFTLENQRTDRTQPFLQRSPALSRPCQLAAHGRCPQTRELGALLCQPLIHQERFPQAHRQAFSLSSAPISDAVQMPGTSEPTNPLSVVSFAIWDVCRLSIPSLCQVSAKHSQQEPRNRSMLEPTFCVFLEDEGCPELAAFG